MGLLLNGTVQGVISPSCGLRQGDPLSPDLFIIAADVLSRLLMTKNEAASVKEANNFLKCFDEYCAWSGQAVNYQKSTVYFTQGVPSNKAKEIMNILGMKRMQNDSIYLGLPLFRSFKRSKDLNFLVDKVMKRVKSWKTRLLSKAGRACLIQSVGSSLATYVAASDVIPKTIARKVDKELTDFWKIETINSAFILKWGWKALTDKESVWGTIIQNKYLNHRNFFDVEINSRDSSFWKSILKSRSLLLNHVCRKIGNGKETSIWFDLWVPSANRSPTPLLDATHGVAWVNQFITEDDCWDEEMIKNWFNRADTKAILNIQLPQDDVKDDWLWMGEPSGLFSIKSACRFVKGENSATSVNPKWKMIWNSKVHPRLKLIWWQMERNAFPTRGKLSCVMELNSICCPVGGEETETFFHLMWKCTYAKALWFNSSLGLRVELVDAHDWEQWKNWFLEDTNRPPNITFLEIMVIALCVMEAMWKERNSVVHGQSKNSIWQVLSNINRKIREQLHVVSNAVEDFCAWSPPPASWLCCNCDVSCDDEGMVVATVVRDDQGRIVTIKTERNHLTDPLIGEVVAVCMAAKLMIDKKVAHVVFQSDNIETVKAFSNATDRDCNFKLVNLRSRFQQLCKGFQNWEVGHVPRRCNFMAHNIAKWARENSVTGIILCSDLTAEVLSDYVEWNKHAG
uniref:Reverse transcriptase n=1 Tax=Cannabis sativa TaxID=3483 RepID=A0A803PDD3_CANSA